MAAFIRILLGNRNIKKADSTGLTAKTLRRLIR
jgi:hypothetical protein